MCYVILSDIHANYTALEAVLQTTKSIAEAKKYYFLGDLLGYGPTSQVIACMDWLWYQSGIYDANGDNEVRWVPGNHDEWAVTRQGRVRPEGTVTLLAQCKALEHIRAKEWETFTAEVRAALNDDSRALLTKTRGAGKEELFMAFTHGGATADEWRGTYLYPWESSVLRKHFAPLCDMTDAATKILFCGHTHLPYLAEIRQDEKRSIVFHPIKYGQPETLSPGDYIICPGSVGHPRDGDCRAAFVLFDPESRKVEFRRVEYDTRPVVEALCQEQFARHSEVARYLVLLDATRLRDEKGIEVNAEEDVPAALLRQYEERVEAAYANLIREIETGYGGEEEQQYHAHVYCTPKWDLEPLPPELR